MLVKIYSVFDSKASAFMLPQFYQTAGIAERAFSEAVNTKDTPFNKYPEDFTLFELGVYDDENASFDLHTTPVSMGVAIQFKRSSE
jgi:hypothetical protein